MHDFIIVSRRLVERLVQCATRLVLTNLNCQVFIVKFGVVRSFNRVGARVRVVGVKVSEFLHVDKVIRLMGLSVLKQS